MIKVGLQGGTAYASRIDSYIGDGSNEYVKKKGSAIGQARGSSFSSNPSRKSKWGVVFGFSDVYLWSYDENGNKIPPIKYQ